LGTFANPIYHADGNYPKIVRERVDNVSRQEGYLQSRLPVLSPPEIEYIQGTFDFLGLNIYTTYLVKDAKEETSEKSSLKKDMRVQLYQDEKWPKSNSDWLRVVPYGVRKVLKWIKDKYDDPDIIITENGFSDKGEINDINRIRYYQKYLSSLLEAIHEDQVSVKAFAAWSLIDNFEWNRGYRSVRTQLHEIGLTFRKFFREVQLTERHRREREEWARKRRNWDRKWNIVIFVDESHLVCTTILDE
ncbi:hypothetical protein NQ314_019663, partial [Rhamnusium bicolor]